MPGLPDGEEGGSLLEQTRDLWNSSGSGAGEGGSDNKGEGGRRGQGVHTPLKSMQFWVLLWIRALHRMYHHSNSEKNIKITSIFFLQVDHLRGSLSSTNVVFGWGELKTHILSVSESIIREGHKKKLPGSKVVEAGDSIGWPCWAKCSDESVDGHGLHHWNKEKADLIHFSTTSCHEDVSTCNFQASLSTHVIFFESALSVFSLSPQTFYQDSCVFCLLRCGSGYANFSNNISNIPFFHHLDLYNTWIRCPSHLLEELQLALQQICQCCKEQVLMVLVVFTMLGLNFHWGNLIHSLPLLAPGIASFFTGRGLLEVFAGECRGRVHFLGHFSLSAVCWSWSHRCFVGGVIGWR